MIRELIVNDWIRQNQEDLSHLAICSRLIVDAHLIEDKNNPHIVVFDTDFKKQGFINRIVRFVLSCHENDIKIQYTGIYIMKQYKEDLWKVLYRYAKEKKEIEKKTKKEWMTQLIRAVNILHGEQIAHLDIKPGNVFVDEDDNLCLGDFGLAAPCVKDGPFMKTLRPYLWNMDIFVCTVGFRPPELYNPLPPHDPKWDKYSELDWLKLRGYDIFALGMTLLCIEMRWPHPPRSGNAKEAHEFYQTKIWPLRDDERESRLVRDIVINMLHPENDKRKMIEL